MIRPALAAALLLAVPALAEGPSVDTAAVRACHAGAAPFDMAPACIGLPARACQDRPDGSTTSGIVACISAETQVWDTLLNEEYALLRDALREDDARGMMQGLSRADALQGAQRAWIAFRDADCGLAWAIWQDGTIRGPIAADCRLAHTARRALELRNLRRDGEGGL
jgi:uncharacterized protein YecT (DUF1311 family)